VSPSAATIIVGGTQQLTATVTDALGSLIGGLLTTWTTSNAAVASVSTSGRVTAVAPGTATITANTAGLVATSAITVVSGAPTPSGNWPNAPSAYPLISDQPFDLLNSLGWSLTSNHYTSIVLDPTAPQSPSSVLQFMYPVGFTSGSAPGTEYVGLPRIRHFYSGVWWKPSAPWQGDQSNVNKLQFVMADQSQGGMYLCMYGPPGGPYELRVANEFVGGDSRFWFSANVAHVPVTLGQWHRVEWSIEYSATGAADGTIKFWMDGQLLGEYHDFKGPSATMIEYQISPTFGGMGSTKAQTDYFWFDHAYVKGY
jgi:hypothetical protein